MLISLLRQEAGCRVIGGRVPHFREKYPGSLVLNRSGVHLSCDFGATVPPDKFQPLTQHFPSCKCEILGANWTPKRPACFCRWQGQKYAPNWGDFHFLRNQRESDVSTFLPRLSTRRGIFSSSSQRHRRFGRSSPHAGDAAGPLPTGACLAHLC